MRVHPPVLLASALILPAIGCATAPRRLDRELTCPAGQQVWSRVRNPNDVTIELYSKLASQTWISGRPQYIGEVEPGLVREFPARVGAWTWRSNSESEVPRQRRYWVDVRQLCR